MATRQRTQRLDSSVVQGEGSYVLVKALTVAQHNRRLALIRGMDGADDAAQATIDRQMRELFAEVVVEWDWVGDDGKPLPQPTDASVYDRLTMPEMQFIAQAVQSASTLSAEKKAP